MAANADKAVALLADALPAAAWIEEPELGDYAVQGVRPLLGIRPETEEQAVAAMHVAAADAWAVVPWGHGTAQGRGAPPEQYDCCFSTERMTGVIEHHQQDMVATVRAGTSVTDLQRVLAEQAQWWPLDPPGADATVGGVLATNRSGPRRARFGTARDLVLGMRVLHADGVVTKHGGKVVKNVTGFDLNKLHIGGLGTLGIILEVSLRLRPVPLHETVLAAPFTDHARAAVALAEVASSELAPTAVELLNGRAAEQVVPPMAGDAVALVAVEGPPTAIERQTGQVADVFGKHGGGQTTTVDRDDVRVLWETFRDLGTTAPEPAVLWCGLAALPQHVPALAVAVESIAADHSQRLLLDCRAADGVFRLGLIGQPEPALAERTVHAWREVAAAHGGTLVVEDAPANVRDRLDPWGPPRQDFFLMDRIKRSLDPKRLFNRGRYVGGL